MLRMIRRVVGVGRDTGKPVSVCGAMAGDAFLNGARLQAGIRLEGPE